MTIVASILLCLMAAVVGGLSRSASCPYGHGPMQRLKQSNEVPGTHVIIRTPNGTEIGSVTAWVHRLKPEYLELLETYRGPGPTDVDEHFQVTVRKP